jgi:hypothetical protein
MIRSVKQKKILILNSIKKSIIDQKSNRSSLEIEISIFWRFKEIRGLKYKKNFFNIFLVFGSR